MAVTYIYNIKFLMTHELTYAYAYLYFDRRVINDQNIMFLFTQCEHEPFNGGVGLTEKIKGKIHINGDTYALLKVYLLVIVVAKALLRNYCWC